MVHRLVGSVGVLGRERAPAPGWAATTTSVTLASPVPLCSTIATWAGLMKTSPSPAWRLNCTRFIGCPARRAHPCAFSLPDCLHRGHRYIVVQIESDQVGVPGSLVAYALS